MSEPRLRVLRIVEGTSVDGPGLRTSIYFAGCAHHCPGCHNPQSWDFGAGSPMSVAEIMAVIDYNGADVTFSGGDPFYQSTAAAVLAAEIKKRGLGLWVFTGFLLDELLAAEAPEGARRLLEYVDVLVDGPYVAALRDTSLLFRGSSNQRLIDLQAMRATGTTAPILWSPSF
ncbi:MAG: anaerobic ribonucleoside-triphosphate reductase activating protein [Muribaculaceae bacterium]|nr:anaerobic ribonucleoside-triphosphate reductase activating protein [Muribaculaceae bacterium]